MSLWRFVIIIIVAVVVVVYCTCRCYRGPERSDYTFSEDLNPLIVKVAVSVVWMASFEVLVQVCPVRYCHLAQRTDHPLHLPRVRLHVKF